jgi:UDP-glucuronate 4-epimerase
MANPRPILVTGAGGLLGRGVVEHLMAQGRAVLPVDRAAPPDSADFTVELAELTDAPLMRSLVERGVAGIIHCGGISGPMVAPDQPALVSEINVSGTLTLLEAMRRAGTGRFVYCSSVAAYGATPEGLDPVPESAPLAAAGIYGASKAASDLLTRAYAREHGLDAVVLRIGWVYGPRRRTESLPHTLIRDALAGRETVVPHDGGATVQPIFVEDVVSALVAAFDASGVAGHAYTTTGDTRLPQQDLAALVQKILPQARFRFTPGALYKGALPGRFDISAAARDLHWQPRVGLEEGLRRYADWLAQHEY